MPTVFRLHKRPKSCLRSSISTCYPSGLLLNAATGLISGTPNGTGGTFSFTVQVSDTTGAIGNRAYTLTVRPVITNSPTSGSTLPCGSIGASYNLSFVPGGGETPYTYSLASGSLPGGLTLSQGSTLSGTPIVSGTFNFTLRIADARGFDNANVPVVTPPPSGVFSYTLIVDPAVNINPVILPNGQYGVLYPAVAGTATP